jgi:multidrug efflux pump subunit AcrA (membrane-fusion protein)
VFRGADGGWQVFAIRDSVAKLTPVEVGLTNDERVEIVKGLAENDEVVLAPESSLVDDTRVNPIFRD